MMNAKVKTAARPDFVPGQVVAIVGGTYKGQAGQLRGLPDKNGALPLLVRGKVRRVKPENIGG